MNLDVFTLISLLVPPGQTLGGVALLVWYRQRKRFPKERVKGLFAFLDANMVELIIGAAILPDWLPLIAQVLNA